MTPEEAKSVIYLCYESRRKLMGYDFNAEKCNEFIEIIMDQAQGAIQKMTTEQLKEVFDNLLKEKEARKVTAQTFIHAILYFRKTQIVGDGGQLQTPCNPFPGVTINLNTETGVLRQLIANRLLNWAGARKEKPKQILTDEECLELQNLMSLGAIGDTLWKNAGNKPREFYGEWVGL